MCIQSRCKALTENHDKEKAMKGETGHKIDKSIISSDH
jgi:hypothetical protein